MYIFSVHHVVLEIINAKYRSIKVHILNIRTENPQSSNLYGKKGGAQKQIVRRSWEGAYGHRYAKINWKRNMRNHIFLQSAI